MSEKITYEVSGYSLLDGDSESLSVMAFTNDLDEAKLLADYSVRHFGCVPISYIMRGKSILTPLSEIFPDDIPY